MEDNKLVVGYWAIQAFAHPIRLLLAYHKVPFEDKQYSYDNRDEWFLKDKPALKTAFPNIPYVKDGDIVVTESLATIQYAALKTGNKDLMGKTELDQIRCTQLWGLYKDHRGELYWLARRDFAEKDRILKEKFAPLFEKISKFLGEKEYLLGYMTWADFNHFFLIDVVSRMDPEFIKQWPNLVKYHERINNDDIKAYRKSKDYPRFYVNAEGVWNGEEKF